jgi:hypothetical protein
VHQIEKKHILHLDYPFEKQDFLCCLSRCPLSKVGVIDTINKRCSTQNTRNNLHSNTVNDRPSKKSEIPTQKYKYSTVTREKMAMKCHFYKREILPVFHVIPPKNGWECSRRSMGANVHGRMGILGERGGGAGLLVVSLVGNNFQARKEP